MLSANSNHNQSVDIFDLDKLKASVPTMSETNSDESSTIRSSASDISDEEKSSHSFDPKCVAHNPYVVTFQDITSAAFLIKSGIEVTPCTVREKCSS